jgi:hypothetical protein
MSITSEQAENIIQLLKEYNRNLKRVALSLDPLNKNAVKLISNLRDYVNSNDVDTNDVDINDVDTNNVDTPKKIEVHKPVEVAPPPVKVVKVAPPPVKVQPKPRVRPPPPAFFPAGFGSLEEERNFINTAF